VSEQHEEESLRRWAREQAEIERQTDALVLRTLTAMVTAAEDLKSKLRRDTESMLEEYRKTKRGLENEIGLSTAERQKFRREMEQERETIISDANTQAKDIVDAAEREREQLLRETRTMEQRLRGIEGQIRSLFGQQAGIVDVDAKDPPAAPAAATTPSPGTTSGRGFTASTFSRATSPFTSPVGSTPAPAVATPTPAFPTPASAADDDDSAASALVEDEAELVDDVEEEATTSVTAPVFTPAPPPPVVSAQAPIISTSTPRPAASKERRLVELVFDGVPGYQQASALERAIDDLVPDGEVDIVDFERGQLVLNVQVADLEALAEQLVATSPASLALEGVDGDRATFHCS
jgi:hypothetical protein